MMTEIQKEELQKELQKIKDEKVRKLAIRAFSRVPEEFWKAGASSTGKYHPPMSQGEGGLWRHTRAVVFFVESITAIEQTPVDDRDKDLLVAAALLHDSCKYGLPWGKYTHEKHPLLVFALLDFEEKDADLDVEDMAIWDEINFLISSHMGQWNKNRSQEVILPKPKSGLQKILHLADYLASRKEVDLKHLSVEKATINHDSPF